MISPAVLDDLMHRGWPALSVVEVDGWLVRLSKGVTHRANSALPVRAPGNLSAALERVEQLYRDHGLAPTFQISPAAQPPDLDAVLADKGYERSSPTEVQVAGVDEVVCRLAVTRWEAAVAEEPDDQWIDLWWSVDGRGGVEARPVARRLLAKGPALYASIRVGGDVAAVGRLALVNGWGGIYCMAVRPDVRRGGHASAVLRALLERASSRGVEHAWLQVGADNHPARALYRRAGFTNASRYHYRSRT